MSRLNDQFQHVIERVFNIDNNHLRPGHHHFADLGFRYLKHAGKHALLFGIKFRVGFDKGLDFIAAPGFTLDRS